MVGFSGNGFWLFFPTDLPSDEEMKELFETALQALGFLFNEEGVAIDKSTALVAAGIPPSLPNFDQLTDDGLDYLAEQAVEQSPVPIPPELHDQAKDAFKAGVKAGYNAATKSANDSLSYVPQDVPVKADPFAEIQPPSATFQLARRADSPGQCVPGSIAIDAPMSAAQPSAKDIVGKLPGGWLYTMKTIPPLPPLEPGKSITWTVELHPDWVTGFYDYGASMSEWMQIYGASTLRMSVSTKCSSADMIEVPPDETYLATNNEINSEP